MFPSLLRLFRNFAKKTNTMEKNMGTADKVVRIAIAATIAILYFTNQLSGTGAIILMVLAVVFVLTSFISFCPLYLPFGISTRGKKEKK